MWWCVVAVWCHVHSKPPVCTISKRARVYVQNVPVCTGTHATHVETHVRVVHCRHGDVLNVHTGTQGDRETEGEGNE